jgi:hypothetical protein
VADSSFSDPDAVDPSREEELAVKVAFTGSFIGRIDTLVNHLSGIDTSDSKAAQKRAVATAVAVLSKYAGKRLYVEENGKFQEIADLWRTT